MDVLMLFTNIKILKLYYLLAWWEIMDKALGLKKVRSCNSEHLKPQENVQFEKMPSTIGK